MPFCGNLGHEETRCCFKQKASAEAQKKAKFKTEAHENNVIEIDNFSDEFELLDDLPEIQEFMDNMDLEVSTTDFPQTVKQDTNSFHTPGLILEVSVAVIISSKNESTSILLNKALLDTGLLEQSLNVINCQRISLNL
jgi:hypothetical protein